LKKRYSQTIVIPTRNRQETAIFSIQSCLNVNYDNKQVVVVDNSDDDSLRKQLSDAGILRSVDYHKNNKVLSMRDNWERGLELADGELVSVIGDDDAILGSSMEVANFAFNNADIDVLNGGAAIYKWPNYPFPGRRNYLSFGFGEEIKIIRQPREQLRGAYTYEITPGTGPGLYYGFVKKEFLSRLKATRGKYLIDKIPDFDSGYCTFLYAKAYALSDRPLFIQGHSAKSNSGVMRYTASQRKNIGTFAAESAESVDGLFDGALSDLRSNEAVIISAQLRFLSEVEKEIGKNAVELNKEKAWKYILNGLSDGYDAIGFISAIPALKKLSEEWGIPYTLNNKFEPAINNNILMYEQGFVKKKNLNSTENTGLNSPGYDAVVVNGASLGFKNILDAVKYIDAMLPTMRASPDKNISEHAKNQERPGMEQKLNQSRKLIENGEFAKAKNLLDEIVSVGDVGMVTNLEIDAVAENLLDYEWASRYYARRYSATGHVEELNKLISYFKKTGDDQLVDKLEHGLSLINNS
jgi:glycosyltransferase involved in cell wall biosynthesis